MIHVTTRGRDDFITADTFTVQATTGTLHVYDGSRLAVVYAAGAWSTARRVTDDEAETIRAERTERTERSRWLVDRLTQPRPDEITSDASTTTMR